MYISFFNGLMRGIYDWFRYCVSMLSTGSQGEGEGKSEGKTEGEGKSEGEDEDEGWGEGDDDGEGEGGGEREGERGGEDLGNDEKLVDEYLCGRDEGEKLFVKLSFHLS